MGTPSYQLVLDHIIAGVKAGLYKPGDKLPTIRLLAGQLDVSQTAVKTALMILKERSIVRGQQGKGSFITENPPVG